ncbi:hypothetical protein N9W34_00115 [Rickettsiales bacterium]|nr:hypothetical protein [Rickettsiales bacterium]
MKTLKLLTLTTILAGSLVMQPAFAAKDKATQSDPTYKTSAVHPVVQKYRETLKQANTMLAHVNMAYVASDLELMDSAVEHIKAAQKIANQLEVDSPSITSDTKVKYGKLSYEYKGKSKNYYIPVLNGVFAVHDFEDILKRSGEVDIEETDAELVHAKIAIDIREVKNALSEALDDAENERYDEAMISLADVYKGALTDEEIIEDPLFSIQDNLSLAQNLLNHKYYDSARFALNHARKGLKTYKKDLEKRKEGAENVNDMDKKISMLEEELKKKDPTLLQKADEELSEWGNKVKGWFKK